MTADSSSAMPFPSPNAFRERLATLLPEFDAVDWVKSTGSTNKDLGDFVAGGWSFPVGEDIHYRVVDNCIGEGVAADVASARVPLEKLDVGD